MKVLITGFEPFGGEKINPALEAVKKLDDEIAGAKIIKAEIPTVFRKSIEELEKIIEREKPDITICVGQAGGRFDITIERVAINIDDARIPDNEGNQPIDEPIFLDGLNAYFAKLPIKAMVKELRENKIPASVSNSAGTFVCNHIMYGLLYLIDKKYPAMRGGFIHVPFIPEQVIDKRNTPSMSLDNITKGIGLAIKAAIENKEDIKEKGGKIC
ncbi:pyroglutamyl-peptidase I . Cysteine peptidase. MEROPS family C15 [Caloranaerobacter azorensis DSM 13643]|uniref:Pyrrolidone-carboxylate peptidase n=1 Tax=Caloranaerobacter azorensis DSM 13643 TaxID=1121264 RepID=A0A1M5WPF9_9FIRM|nr:pyroglutamyl-peptidase I [Caloranaerobacter azorensis]SHH89379.1 pyroglutamyl-peptidase I . Cysteine peptidase. MEROPS family C15 [Caloranaerobacter azorensis DSM 13643]